MIDGTRVGRLATRPTAFQSQHAGSPSLGTLATHVFARFSESWPTLDPVSSPFARCTHRVVGREVARVDEHGWQRSCWPRPSRSRLVEGLHRGRVGSTDETGAQLR